MPMTSDQIVRCIRDNYTKLAPSSPYRPDRLARRLGVRLSAVSFFVDALVGRVYLVFKENKNNNDAWDRLNDLLTGREPVDMPRRWLELLGSTRLLASLREDCYALRDRLNAEDDNNNDDVEAAELYGCLGDSLTMIFKLPR